MSALHAAPELAHEVERSRARTATWNFESLSWLAPKVPLRQVICILGAGQDAVAEQFRLLGTRLEHLRERRRLKTILITSSLPEEGKSFVAWNLAVAAAQRGRNRVLLLESDLRQAGYCSALGLSPVPGLKECCSSSDELSQFVYRISGLDVCLLPAGQSPNPPMRTLASRRMRQVLEESGEVFDWVLVDSAPLLPVADSVVLAHLCDGVLLVVRRNRARKSTLKEGLERVEPEKLLGLVLNDFPSHRCCEQYFRSAAATRWNKLFREERKAA